MTRPGASGVWPPFEDGNTAALRHGAHSERKLRPLVDQLLEGLATVAPWTSGAAFAPTVQAWAWAEARAVTYRRHFDEAGMDLDAEEPPRGLDQWDRAERRAANLRAELGLSPTSLARLMSSLSSIDAPAAQSGLDALRAAGAALRLATVQPALPSPPSEGNERAEDGEPVGDGRDGVHVDEGQSEPIRQDGAA